MEHEDPHLLVSANKLEKAEAPLDEGAANENAQGVNELCKNSFEQSATLLERKEASSVEITQAFLSRLDEVQKTVRPMAKIARERAILRAEQSDKRRAQNKARSRYDGVPLTLKESINIAGMSSTIGLESRKDHIAEKNAVVTDLVEDAGMVILGKTNLSQLMLFNESRNPVYGETQNPFDENRGPGGSSGGEAAAIAAHGSAGGFGTDIGGSIRVPAHYCGIFGIKPTVDRISNRGIISGIPGQEVIRGQVGPMARSVSDLRVLFDVVSPQKCALKDPRVAPLPLMQNTKALKDLRVGVFANDGFLASSNACVRAVDEARALLEKAGVTLVDYTPPFVEEIIFTYIKALSSDGAKTARAQLEEGSIDPALTLLLNMAKMPKGVKKLGGRVLGMAVDERLGKLMRVIDEKTVQELWSITKRVRELEAAVFDYWNTHELDAILCPPYATPALYHQQSRDFVLGGALAMRYNFLNLPAGVAPMTRVRSHEEHTEREPSLLAKRANAVDEGSAGLPVGVQVVTRRYREDVLLEILECLEDGASQEDDYPRV